MLNPFNLPLQHALKAITMAVKQTHDGPQPPDVLSICRLTMLAIEHGAPIYNRGGGGHRDCACIYHHLAQGLLGLLPPHQDAECGDFDAPLRQFVDDRLRPLLRDYPTVPTSEPAADELAWKLRRAFDKIAVVAEGLLAMFMVVDMTLASLRATDSELSGDIIGDLLELAIYYGAPLFDMKSRKGCAAIYLYTATKIHEMLLKARKSDLQQCAYAQLHPIVVDNLCVAATEVAASELAWKLRHAFNAILKQIKQSKEQEQEQEVALPLETQKVEGLQRWARGAKVATLAIVFTDVLGSTALNRKHGNVKWNGILSTHVDYGKKLIAREYGYLMQTNGDSLRGGLPQHQLRSQFCNGPGMQHRP